MEVGEEGFTEVEDSTGEAALRPAADAPTAGIVAAAPMVHIVEEAITEGGVITEAAAGMAGEAGATAGAEDTVTATADGAGVGDLAMGGLIGVTDGDIRITTVTVRGITRPILITRTRITLLRAIPRAIRILTTGATILRRQIPTHGRCPTRTDRQDPGDLRYREERPIRTTQTAISRRLRLVGQFSLSTG